MRRRLPFGVLALIPAAVGSAPAYTATLALPLCDGGHARGSFTVPMGHAPLPSPDNPGCCAKGCHGSRKRAGPQPVDPTQ